MRTLRSSAEQWLVGGLCALMLGLSGGAWAQDVPAEGEGTAAADEGVETPDQEKNPNQRANVRLPPPGNDGRGIALSDDGRARLHLSLDAGAGFDTNPYSLPFDNPQFAGDVVSRVRPGLGLTYPGSLLAFDGTFVLDYGFLPGVVNSKTRNFFLYQSALNANLEVNRGGMFTFAIGDSFSWNNDPGVVALGSTVNRLNNALRAGIGLRPGGGTLGFKLDYAFDFEKWFDILNETPGASELLRLNAFDQMSHIGSLGIDWRFLPRTGLFGQLKLGYHTYPFSTVDLNPSSFPLSVRVGLKGQITPKLSGLVSLGYDNPLIFDDGAIQTATVIGVAGQAELRWLVGPTTRVSGGILRRFSPAPLYQYLTNNRVYLGLDQQIGGKLTFGAYAGFSLLEFGLEQPLPGGRQLTTVPQGRLDGDLDLRARLSYQLLDWLSFGLVNNLDWRITNASDTSETPSNLSFLTNETLVLASIHY